MCFLISYSAIIIILLEIFMTIKVIKLFLFFSLIFVSFELSSMEGYKKSEQAYFVGELGANWQFPSDHLPRGATLGNFHIAFWNVLNKDYLFHIENNTQGLRESSILVDNVPVEPNKPLTVREMICGQMVLEMINHPTHPRSLIALQETHVDLQDYLKENLPAHWTIVTPEDQPNSQDIFLYNMDVFEFIDDVAVKYFSKSSATIFTLTLREIASNKVFRFLQSHIPGGPINSTEGCRKFSEEALKQYDPNLTIVLMGDMNQTQDVIQKALEKAAENKEIIQPFNYLPIAYPSHINTQLEATWIDHFFIYSSDTFTQASDDPEEMFASLATILELIGMLSIQ